MAATVASNHPAGTGTPRGSARKALKLVGGLYVTQYLGIGFFTIGLVGILRDSGVSLATLGLIQLIGIIWPLKVFWSPLVDRFGSRRLGHYRSWLLIFQTGLVLSLIALVPFTDPAGSLGIVLTLCAIYVVCSATQDIAADAIAVRMLTGTLRGWGNGIQVAATYLGSVIGGGLSIAVYDRFGWMAALGLLTAATLVGLVLVLQFREPVRTTPPTALSNGFRALGSVLGQPGCRPWALVTVPLLYSGSAGIYALVTPALVDAGWSLTLIGTVTAIIASIPAILAGVAAGGAIARWGRAPVLIIGVIVLLTGSIGLLVTLTGEAPTALTIITLCVFMSGYTATNVVAYTVTMDFSRPSTAGTDFTLLTSIGLAVSFIASSLGLALAGVVGYLATGSLALALVLAGCVLGYRQLRAIAKAPAPIGVGY
ncbi:MFS transporter [Arthrobacter echini]|uniref:MFS transporter n=1 Tax=Arthrobacter echini TaxID=1529066 RepID=A0A4S5E020_9MICC|nr:MFS transporter [Arthrobacter echini]THJ64631.1 MFS transporter [Arthrobacter echini]